MMEEKENHNKRSDIMSYESIIDIMRKRKSIRTYDTRQITETELNKIGEYINTETNFYGPFGKKGKVELIQVTNNVSDKGIKLGTYGFIKNPKAYIVGITENDKDSLVDFAYSFHKFVLYVTGLGMGTCWMGGTFNRDSFEQEVHLEEGEFIPCISPVGYPRANQRVFDKAVRLAVKADNKKSWNKLFFNETFSGILTEAHAGEFNIPIEMVRLGPSASNKQPWRLVLSADQKICHFFIEHTPNYSSKLGYDMQLLDIGIAMCQFDLACRQLNIEGEWVIENPKIELPNEQTEYIASWKKINVLIASKSIRS